MGLETTRIPNGWAHASLEAVCQILDSRRIPLNNSERSRRIAGKSADDLYPYYGATGQVGVIDDFIFDGEHILLGEDGAPFLDPFKVKSYLVDGKFWVNNHAHILKSTVSNQYLCHYLNQINYSDYVTGTTRLKLTQNALKRIPVLVAPIAEQRRIIVKIKELFSELDKGIESLKMAREKLNVYRQAVLKHAFEGKLTAQWREENKDRLESPELLLDRIKREREARYERQRQEWKAAVKEWEESGKHGKKPTTPKFNKPQVLSGNTAPITASRIPSGWNQPNLLEVTELNPAIDEITLASSTMVSFVPMSKVEAVTGNVDVSENRRFEEVRKGYTPFREGDVLFAKITPCMENGKMAVVPPLKNGLGFGSTEFHVLRPSCEICSQYIYFFVSSGIFRRNAAHNMTGAVGQRRVPASYLASQSIPFPSVEEQRRIVARIKELFSSIEQKEGEINTTLNQAEKLRQSILKKAFSGQLVPQDPDDEPASSLLERIKAEKFARSQNNTRSKRKDITATA